MGGLISSDMKTVRFLEQIMSKDQISMQIMAPNGGLLFFFIILMQLPLQYIYLHNLEYSTATLHYLQILAKIPFIVFDTLQYSISYFTLFMILIQLLCIIYNTYTATLHYLRWLKTVSRTFKT